MDGDEPYKHPRAGLISCKQFRERLTKEEGDSVFFWTPQWPYLQLQKRGTHQRHWHHFLERSWRSPLPMESSPQTISVPLAWMLQMIPPDLSTPVHRSLMTQSMSPWISKDSTFWLRCPGSDDGLRTGSSLSLDLLDCMASFRQNSISLYGAADKGVFQSPSTNP